VASDAYWETGTVPLDGIFGKTRHWIVCEGINDFVKCNRTRDEIDPLSERIHERGKKMPIHPELLSQDVLFRYRVVGQVKAFLTQGRSLSEAVCLVAATHHPVGKDLLETRSASERTIRRWVKAYDEYGLKGLEPKKRKADSASQVLSPNLLKYLRSEYENDPKVTIPEIIKRAKQQGHIGAIENVCRTSVWRALGRMGIDTSRRSNKHIDDKRRFAYPERMQSNLSDFIRFRTGQKRLKRIAVYIIDDATRYGLGVAVARGTGENPALFLPLLYSVIGHYGLMDLFYTDKGSAYKCDDTTAVFAQLDRLHIMGRSRYPQGHGKIERFNRSLRHRLLRHFDGNPEIDPDPRHLLLRLRHDLKEVYNHTPHESLDGDTPAQRWNDSKRRLDVPENLEALSAAFIITENRLVSEDNVISYKGRDFDVPFGYAGKKIKIYRHLLKNDALSILHEGRLVRISETDLYVNATTQRARRKKKKDEPVQITKSASMMQFDKMYGSILSPDGGFEDNEE
jgi:putative transposase